MIQENLLKIKERINNACSRSGRNIEEIQLVAVTKNVPEDKILEAVRLGISEIGESRVQESQGKFQFIHRSAPDLKWHLIGHLQSNKVNRAVEFFDLIQSADSEKLLERINRRAQELNKVQECLIEIKISEESAKSGFIPEEIEKILDFSSVLKNVAVKGMMCIAPYFENPEQSRIYFAKGKKIFEKWFKKSGNEPNASLSMGMSNDFETAIEEGSTMIRIGTAIFGSRV